MTPSVAAYDGAVVAQAAPCVHHWRVETRTIDGRLPGHCSLCGAKRTFPTEADAAPLSLAKAAKAAKAQPPAKRVVESAPKPPSRTSVVLAALKTREWMTAQEIADATGLTRLQVTDVLHAVRQHGDVRRDPKARVNARNARWRAV